MHSVQIDSLPLMSFSHVGDDRPPIRATWPVHRGVGSAATAAVYFELEPGQQLGEHTDSAEELLVVLEGEVEAVVGDERGRVAAGGVALVPSLVPHDVISVGDRPAKVLGVFGSNTIVAEFREGFAPTGMRVVGTPPPIDEPAAAAAVAG
jgi:quercetin dioxygenase-like cupin family protein